MLARDPYLQADAPDPVLPPERVIRIVRRYVPAAAVVTAIDESGGQARTYMVDDDLVLKTQRPQKVRPRTSLAKEARFLDVLAGIQVSVPHVFGHGSDGDVEYICMSRMPGVAMQHLTVEGGARSSLLSALGRTLRRIHSLPQPQFYDDPRFPGPRTLADFEAELRAGFERALAGIAREPASWTLPMAPRTFVERVLALPRTEVALVALHSNPSPQHVFVDPDTLTFTGLIDFGDAYIAHPGFDVRFARLDDREALLAGYADEGPLSDAFLAVWRTALTFSDMAALTVQPDRRDLALRSLAVTAATL